MFFDFMLWNSYVLFSAFTFFHKYANNEMHFSDENKLLACQNKDQDFFGVSGRTIQAKLQFLKDYV